MGAIGVNIGATIKSLRAKNGITQYQLAESLNVSMQTVSRWETSATYPDIVMLPLLSKRFNVSVDYLLNHGGNAMKTIESDRLRIREWTEDDAPALCEIALAENYLHFATAHDSLDAIKVWKDHQEMYPVLLKATRKLIGIVGLVDVNRYKGYRELEVHVSDEYRDISHVTELLKLILDYAFADLGLSVAFALCKGNEKVLMQALEQCGFTYEGTLRRFGRDKADRMRYSMMREEYLTA